MKRMTQAQKIEILRLFPQPGFIGLMSYLDMLRSSTGEDILMGREDPLNREYEIGVKRGQYRMVDMIIDEIKELKNSPQSGT